MAHLYTATCQLLFSARTMLISVEYTQDKLQVTAEFTQIIYFVIGVINHIFAVVANIFALLKHYTLPDTKCIHRPQNVQTSPQRRPRAPRRRGNRPPRSRRARRSRSPPPSPDRSVYRFQPLFPDDIYQSH